MKPKGQRRDAGPVSPRRTHNNLSLNNCAVAAVQRVRHRQKIVPQANSAGPPRLQAKRSQAPSASSSLVALPERTFSRTRHTPLCRWQVHSYPAHAVVPPIGSLFWWHVPRSPWACCSPFGVRRFIAAFRLCCRHRMAIPTVPQKAAINRRTPKTPQPSTLLLCAKPQPTPLFQKRKGYRKTRKTPVPIKNLCALAPLRKALRNRPQHLQHPCPTLQFAVFNSQFSFFVPLPSDTQRVSKNSKNPVRWGRHSCLSQKNGLPGMSHARRGHVVRNDATPGHARVAMPPPIEKRRNAQHTRNAAGPAPVAKKVA